MIEWAAVAWKVKPFAVEQAKRWWRRDAAMNLSRLVAGELESDPRLYPAVREELVAQWLAVRDDTLLCRVVAHLLLDADPAIEPLVCGRLLQLLRDLPLILGVQDTAERLAAAVLGQLAAAQSTPDGAARARELRIVNRLDAMSDKLDGGREPAVAAPERDCVRVRFGVPLQAAAFTGRERELELLDAALHERDVAVLAQAIAGLGGIGKSQLAARYVHQHLAAFDVVAWISAEDGGIADLGELAVKVGVAAALAPAERAAAVLEWLQVCEERWLLVLDNLTMVGQLESCCPSAGNGQVIITTRDRSIAQYAATLELEVFDEATAVDYLLTRAKRPRDADGALRVARSLGCLPLALAHAGAYCAAGSSFDEYCQGRREFPTCDDGNSPPCGRPVRAGRRAAMASRWRRMR